MSEKAAAPGRASARAAPATPASSPPCPPELSARVAWLPAAVPEVPPVPIDIHVDAGHALGRLRAGATDSLELVRLARASVDIQRTGQFDNLLALAHTRDVEHFPHQVETARRVLRDMRGSALLADEVGLGKTVEAGLIIKEAILRGLARSVLVLCPPSLVEQWRGEMQSKFGLAFATPNGDSEAFFNSGDLLLCSYALARRREHAERARSRRFDLVVVDEAHHIKSRGTLGFQLVDGLQRRFLLLLTATPVQNHLDELYNLVTLLRPGYLGTRGAFARRFVTRGDPRHPQDREALRALLADVMIRNTRALVDIRLPPRFVRTLAVEPTPAERGFYHAISEYVRGRAASDPGRQRPLLLTLLAEAGSSPAAVFSTLEAQLGAGSLSGEQEQAARDLQCACAAVGETSKDRVLLELLGEAQGDKTVVFVKYRATLAALEGLLRGRGVAPAVFHGGMSAQEKDAAVTAFRDERSVLLSTEVGGEGRNLQFCRRIVNFDLPWNPFAIEQRIGRLHRIGQSREVHVANLCARGTAEDYLLTVLDQKLNMFQLVIGELDMILGELDSEVDIPGRVYSIWSGAKDDAARRAGFDQLGEDLAAARARYGESQQVDAAIFGRDFEAA